MSGLTEFLLARIAEDETEARRVLEALVSRAGADWTVDPEPVDGPLPGTVVAVLDGDDAVAFVRGLPAAAHIARHDPARVLAECQAKRRIVSWMLAAESGLRREGEDPTKPLRALALPYADHPDYREEWRP